MTLGSRSSRHGDFAFRMEGFLGAHRRKHNRRAPIGVEEGHGHVDVLDINESASPNLDARVPFAIRPDSSIVVHTGGEVAKMRWRKCLARGKLKIHHIEGLVWRGNDLVVLLKGIEPAEKLPPCNFTRGQKIRKRTG